MVVPADDAHTVGVNGQVVLLIGHSVARVGHWVLTVGQTVV